MHRLFKEFHFCRTGLQTPSGNVRNIFGLPRVNFVKSPAKDKNPSGKMAKGKKNWEVSEIKTFLNI
ncbi:Uncharacterized protein dnm_036500 [Desulfonema magnum]|uniref:Uncharacterized protein n=1 Tax=Desulfonema magnum TaxID=45655 RepID=A0A975BLV3_9BACT|nr:Uncharacterized protein dnm_036500 [Desulfonema magnum]